MRHILIRSGDVEIRARLLATPTADRIWNALPISGSVRTWGKEVYFRTPVSHDLEPDARIVVSKGEIAFWPDGDAIAIGFGATPIAKRGEIRFTSKCNVWAVALDDVDQLKAVYPGERISVVEAANDDTETWAEEPAACPAGAVNRQHRARRSPQPVRHCASSDEGGSAG
ncbi:cyclophilin-like family protein [Hyphomicrobium sp.]|uniref:cyclophilin-like family protein n=1 Tax=Hyphomicrobium sp. TaxID=82 RepID=UPI002FDD0097